MKKEETIILESGRHILKKHIQELAEIEMSNGGHMDSLEDYDSELEFFLSLVNDEKGQYADCFIKDGWSEELTGSKDETLTIDEAREIAYLVAKKIEELYEERNRDI